MMLMEINRITKKNTRGFTLVELVVVMAILAVLAALAVPKFADVLSDARGSADAVNIKMLQDAVDLYYAQENAYPADLSVLVSDYIKTMPSPSEPGKAFVLDVNHTVIIQ